MTFRAEVQRPKTRCAQVGCKNKLRLFSTVLGFRVLILPDAYLIYPHSGPRLRKHQYKQPIIERQWAQTTSHPAGAKCPKLRMIKNQQRSDNSERAWLPQPHPELSTVNSNQFNPPLQYLDSGLLCTSQHFDIGETITDSTGSLSSSPYFIFQCEVMALRDNTTESTGCQSPAMVSLIYIRTAKDLQSTWWQ